MKPRAAQPAGPGQGTARTPGPGRDLPEPRPLSLEVVRVTDFAPHIRGFQVASPDLLGFVYAPGQDLTIDFPDGPLTTRRRYTVRRADPEVGTVDLEVEIHESDGPAIRWAMAAEVGDRLDAVGPRGKITVRPEAHSHLFLADDSAMPAAFAMIEALPPGTPATAVLVTSHGPSSRPGPATQAEVTVLWSEHGQVPIVIAGLNLQPNLAAYVLGERQLVHGGVETLASAGANRETIASKVYWRRDRPNEAHGEPSRA
jgi:NADPH-dependent ferric siderophore reductase